MLELSSKSYIICYSAALGLCMKYFSDRLSTFKASKLKIIDFVSTCSKEPNKATHHEPCCLDIDCLHSSH